MPRVRVPPSHVFLLLLQQGQGSGGFVRFDLRNVPIQVVRVGLDHATQSRPQWRRQRRDAQERRRSWRRGGQRRRWRRRYPAFELLLEVKLGSTGRRRDVDTQSGFVVEIWSRGRRDRMQRRRGHRRRQGHRGAAPRLLRRRRCVAGTGVGRAEELIARRGPSVGWLRWGRAVNDRVHSFRVSVNRHPVRALAARFLAFLLNRRFSLGHLESQVSFGSIAVFLLEAPSRAGLGRIRKFASFSYSKPGQTAVLAGFTSLRTFTSGPPSAAYLTSTEKNPDKCHYSNWDRLKIPVSSRLFRLHGARVVKLFLFVFRYSKRKRIHDDALITKRSIKLTQSQPARISCATRRPKLPETVLEDKDKRRVTQSTEARKEYHAFRSIISRLPRDQNGLPSFEQWCRPSSLLQVAADCSLCCLLWKYATRLERIRWPNSSRPFCCRPIWNLEIIVWSGPSEARFPQKVLPSSSACLSSAFSDTRPKNCNKTYRVSLLTTGKICRRRCKLEIWSWGFDSSEIRSQFTHGSVTQFWVMRGQQWEHGLDSNWVLLWIAKSDACKSFGKIGSGKSLKNSLSRVATSCTPVSTDSVISRPRSNSSRNWISKLFFLNLFYSLSTWLLETLTCLTLRLDEETLNIPTVCRPNCSKCRMHIMTTVGTQGQVDELGDDVIPIPSSSNA